MAAGLGNKSFACEGRYSLADIGIGCALGWLEFRFPDLLGACVSLAFRDPPSQRRLVEYLVTQLTLRNPRTERRSCDIWAVQFELVMAAHRAPWNRFPNPMFELDQITTACVAVAMSLPDGDALVLGQARLNLRDRASRSRGLEC